jgi:tape measure domain-containing protein
VQAIDMNSAFNFADLADAAALLGNSGVKDIPADPAGDRERRRRGGKGVEGFKSIALALSQIAAKGRLSQEEINQLNEAARSRRAARHREGHFHLTAKELQNLGGQGLDAKEAIDALTAAWTSGKMAAPRRAD